MDAPEWPADPYKGLGYYEPEDMLLFDGRAADVLECAELLAKPRTRVLLLHGWTGCGKSSFLRAGLIPYLESAVPTFQFVRDFNVGDAKALFIRCTEDPLLRLCETLYEWAGNRFPVDVANESRPKNIDITSIRGEARDLAAFVRTNGDSVANLMGVLDRLDDLLPKSMILVIDQSEEVMTINMEKSGEHSRDLFCEFLTAFNNSSLSSKLVVALRSEYFGHFSDEMTKRNYDPNKMASFLLKPLTRKHLIDAIMFPTRHNIEPARLRGRPQPGTYYKFKFDDKCGESAIPEMIVDAFLRKEDREHVLTKIQIQCSRMYKRAKPEPKDKPATVEWKITEQDYEWSGDPERQISLYLDEKLDEKIEDSLKIRNRQAREREREAWDNVLYSLVVKPGTGGSQTNILPESLLREKADEYGCTIEFSMMTQYLANNDQRILRRDRRAVTRAGGEGEPYTFAYSLGGDAIAIELRKWRDDRQRIRNALNDIGEDIRNIAGKVAGWLLGAGVVALVIVVGHEAWRSPWIWLAIAAILVTGLVLFAARRRIGALLSLRVGNMGWFRRVMRGDQQWQSEQTRDAIRSIQDSIKAGHAAHPSANEREALKGAEEALRAKPEKDYTAADWARRAFAAYADGKLDLAAEYFGQAASAAGVTETQRAEYLLNRGFLLGELHRLEEAIAVFDDLLARFGNATEPPLREPVARALVNKGITLGELDRSAEAVAVYDDVVERFGNATELPLREEVGRALVNKGVRLGALDRGAEAVAVYNDVVERFGNATEPPLREHVARALVNKGFRLGELDRSAEEIAAYDDVLVRFGNATELPLREEVGRALVNKGVRLGALDRGAEAVAVYNDVVERFGNATELPLREEVARALANKGFRLGELDRSAEEIAAYDDVLARFGNATEPPLREHVARALVNKGFRLGELNRSAEEIAAYDDVLARFGNATELPLREQVAKALVNKAIVLGALDRSAEAIATLDDLLARFGNVTEPGLREQVEEAKRLRAAAAVTVREAAGT
jgi:tetratricopeptide (TPR) repeat protein